MGNYYPLQTQIPECCNPRILTIFIPSTLVSVSRFRAVFSPVPSFTKTKARIPRSDVGATGPLRASKVAVLGEVV